MVSHCVTIRLVFLWLLVLSRANGALRGSSGIRGVSIDETSENEQSVERRAAFHKAMIQNISGKKQSYQQPQGAGAGNSQGMVGGYKSNAGGHKSIAGHAQAMAVAGYHPGVMGNNPNAAKGSMAKGGCDSNVHPHFCMMQHPNGAPKQTSTTHNAHPATPQAYGAQAAAIKGENWH